MATRPEPGAAGPRLETVAASLGGDVLRAVLLPEPSLPVSGVRVHETGSVQDPARSEIVLAIGTEDVTVLAELLRRLSGVAAAVVAKCRAQDDAELLRAAAGHGCGILVLNDGIDWLQAVALLQGEIARHTDDLGTGPAEGADLVHDLFQLADLAADAIGGPVTVEDPAGWLLAYSSDQAGGDAVRAETLLNRRAPERFSQALAAQGVRQAISRSEAPVVVRGVIEGAADRLAVGLRAGGFALGSMWAVTEGADDRRVAAFARAGQRVAVHLMRRRTEAHRTHHVEMEQLAVLLHGGPTVTGSGDSIDLPDGTHWVAALSIDPSDPSARAVARSRLEHGLALMPRVGGMTVHAGQLSNLWYLVLTMTGARGTTVDTVRDWVRDLLDDGPQGPLPVHAGIGSATDDRAELPRARKEAERALAVARLAPDPGTPLAFEECWARAALIRLLEPTTVADLDTTTPLWRLRRQDAAHSTDYVPTLHAWLEHQGNVRTAAEALHIHANTLRYRLGKIEQTAGIDLADANTRLVLSLQLKATHGM
ncbi:helix-turn-helix domain-containing protein [Streptomyces sp. NPDC004539]|uniref:PucR family transcriptional regulator n=1 Tax=Streptomyces sp. NPDC004539 TaxID=3154280 RepID=UPI0033B6789A